MKNLKATGFTALICLTLTHPARATESSLSLREAEEKALSRSARVQAAEADAEAIKSQALAARAALFPRLALDGSYRYVTDVPTLRVGPATLDFGTHGSYSIGPILSYSLWDGGSSRSAWKSLIKLSEAREEDRKQSTLQAKLAARLAYFRVQLGLQELKLVNESLRLSESQERDIRNRFQAGASSRVDTLSARREVLSLEMKFQQARADLRSSYQDLLALLGGDNESSPEKLALDPQEKSLQDLAQAAQQTTFNPAHPQLESLGKLSEAQRLASQGFEGEHWPRVSVFGKSTLDYPNGPRIEQVWQTTLGVSLSMPLFEGGRASHLAAQKTSESLAAEKRQTQLRTDLERDWRKAKLQLESLQEQRKLAQAAAREASEIAELMYASYKAGRTGFLDVQSANTRALEARVLLARIQAQILIQSATIGALAAQG